MKPSLRIVSGGRSGTTKVFSKNHIAIGRHPESDLQLDPHADLDASSRHAAIVKRGESWFLQDVGSRNGTLLNGYKISGDSKLDDTDQIRLGPDGPLVEFRLVSDKTPDTVATPAGKAPPRPTASARSSKGGKASTTQRVRVEVVRQTRNLRRVIGVLGVVLLAGAGGFWLITRQQRLAQEQEVAQLQAQIDSVLLDAGETVAALQGQMDELANTLERSQRDVQGFQLRLAEAREAGNRANIETLSAQLESALTQLAEQQHAARIDFEGIASANQSAVGLVFVEFGPRQVETGTAFAVRSDGTMLTNRHVVAGPAGNRTPRRIVVQFADSRQRFRAQVVTVSRDQEIDLAVIRVSLRGEVPTVERLNRQPDTVPVGAPVAVIGFPGGIDSPQLELEDGSYAATSLTAGTVSKNLPNLIQINGYGAHGASGSPIFDANGEVVAVLFGGESGSGGRVLYAVPASYALQLLNSVN